MSYNIIAYIFYLAVTLLLVIWVGYTLYHNGKTFLLMCLEGNVMIATSVNKTLLTGYYLINIGYAVYSLRIWDKVDSWLELLETTGIKTGFIVLMLGVMHIINVIVLLLRRKAITASHIEMIKKHTNH